MTAENDARQIPPLAAATENTAVRAVAETAGRRSSLSGWVVLAAAVSILGVAGVMLALMWDWAAVSGLGVKDAASTRLETVKIAASVAVAGGGLFALYLAARRQRTQELELAQRRDEFAHNEHDATQRRVTELYTKAVEQLGSNKAVVRQGGLYALERVAQENPAHRQTVINVICAYLRAPYTPAPDPPGTRRAGLPRPLRNISSARVAAAVSARRMSPNPPSPSPTRGELLQEREVRLTAQRILTAHLRPQLDEDTGQPTNPRYWHEDLDLDLTGATLIDFDVTGCRVTTASFRDVTFTGDARFDGVTFTDDTRFDGATFCGIAWFGNATFCGIARFGGATFTGDASFGGVILTGDAWFDSVIITGDASFEGAIIAGDARFDGASIAGDVRFGGATIMGDARFGGVTITGDARFRDAAITGDARFGGATIAGDVWFLGAIITGDARFGGATIAGDAWFRRATIGGDAWFDGATVDGDAWFDGAAFNGGARFDGAAFESIVTAADVWVRVSQSRSRASRSQLESSWPAGWIVDGSAGVPRSGKDGRWAQLVPMPIVLATPPEG